MKKQIFQLILVVFFINITYSQKVIEMEKVNGTYQIPCKVNGIPMKFIFDTGATDVTISIIEAKFLLKQGLITKEDFIENANYQIANGDVIEGTKIYLKTIEIGGIVLKNIPASIIYQQNAPLLLGQSAIEKIGQYSINGNKLILNDFEKISINQDGFKESALGKTNAKNDMPTEYVTTINSINVCFYDDVPIMFATKQINIYKSKSTKSQILGIIHINSEVSVLNSTYKSTGWLKVCCFGIDGWVKNQTLTSEIPEEVYVPN